MPEHPLAGQARQIAVESGLVKRPTTKAAKAFLRWWIPASGEWRINPRGKDLFDHVDGLRRFRLKTQVLEEERRPSTRGDWHKVGSWPLIDVALRAFRAVAGEADASPAQAKRSAVKQKAARKRVEHSEQAHAYVLAAKAIEGRYPDVFEQAARRGVNLRQLGLDDEINRLAETFRQQYAGRFPDRDEGLASIRNPPWLPLLHTGAPISYRWVEQPGTEHAVAIEIRGDGHGLARVYLIASPDAHMVLNPITKSVEALRAFWTTTEIPSARGHLTGRLEVAKDGSVIPVAVDIQAGTPGRGQGRWLLQLWCRLIAGYGRNSFIIEAPTERGGQPFVEALMARGDLTLLDRTNGYWAVRCAFQPTRSIPFVGSRRLQHDPRQEYETLREVLQRPAPGRITPWHDTQPSPPAVPPSDLEFHVLLWIDDQLSGRSRGAWSAAPTYADALRLREAASQPDYLKDGNRVRSATIYSPLAWRVRELHPRQIAWLIGWLVGLILQRLGSYVDPSATAQAALQGEIDEFVNFPIASHPGQRQQWWTTSTPPADAGHQPAETPPAKALEAVALVLREIVEWHGGGMQLPHTTDQIYRDDLAHRLQQLAELYTVLLNRPLTPVPAWNVHVNLSYVPGFRPQPGDAEAGVFHFFADSYTREAAQTDGLDQFHDEWPISEVDMAYVWPFASAESVPEEFWTLAWQRRWIDWLERHGGSAADPLQCPIRRGVGRRVRERNLNVTGGASERSDEGYAKIARQRVREKLDSERTTHSGTLLVRLGSDMTEEWDWTALEGKQISGGRIGRIVMDLPSDPIAGLVWGEIDGEPKIVALWTDETLRRHGAMRALLDVYRRIVSPRAVAVGPYSFAGRATAQALVDVLEDEPAE